MCELVFNNMIFYISFGVGICIYIVFISIMFVKRRKLIKTFLYGYLIFGILYGVGFTVMLLLVELDEQAQHSSDDYLVKFYDIYTCAILIAVCLVKGGNIFTISYYIKIVGKVKMAERVISHEQFIDKIENSIDNLDKESVGIVFTSNNVSTEGVI